MLIDIVITILTLALLGLILVESFKVDMSPLQVMVEILTIGLIITVLFVPFIILS